MTHLNTTVWWALIPLMAYADRMVGSDHKNPKSLGNGPVILVALAALALRQWVPASLLAAWLAYRNVPWKLGGTTTPRTPAQMVGSLVRHSVPLLAAAPLVINGLIQLSATWPLAVFAVFATLQHIGYAKYIDSVAAEDTSVNAAIEITRGLAFGAAAAAVIVYS